MDSCLEENENSLSRKRSEEVDEEELAKIDCDLAMFGNDEISGGAHPVGKSDRMD